MGRAVTDRRSGCPISYALDLLGDKWTLLVLRDLLLMNKRHYRELLAAEEGIATNILADRLKRLDAKPMKRWGTIQEYRMTVNNIFKDLPDFRAFIVNYLFRALDCLHDSTFDQLPDDERLEQFDCHVFWQTTLV